MTQIKKRPTPPQRHRHGDPIGAVDRKQAKRSSNGNFAIIVGVVFTGYVFNAAGLQTHFDGFGRGMDHALHQHDAAVVSASLAALPYLAVLVIAFAASLLFTSAAKKKSRRRPAKAGKPTEASDFTAAKAQAEKPERVWVRPRAFPGIDTSVAILVDTGNR